MAESQEPLSFTIRQVLSLTDVDLKAASSTLGAAFANDKFTDVVTAGDKEFYADFWGTTVTAGSLAGEVYFAENDAKEVIGVAVWFGPGREMYDSDDQKEKALGVLMARFSPELQQWWGVEFLPKFEEFTTKSLGEGVKLASWQLQTLGTHPDYQRRGVARALVNTMKAKAAKDGTTLCLEVESEINLGIYDRLGFKIKGETIFKGLKGEVPMWTLLAETT